MHRTRARILLLLFCLPLPLRAALRLDIATPLLNAVIKKELSGVFNGQVRFEGLRSNLISFVEVRDLSVLSAQGEPLLNVASLRLDCAVLDFVAGRKTLRNALTLVTVQGMKLSLTRDEKGRWNVAGLLAVQAPASASTGVPAPKGAPIVPLKVLLKDSSVAFSDQGKGFHSSLSIVESVLGAGEYPKVSFSVLGRSEGQKRDNLSLSGIFNVATGSLDARLGLDEVALKTYLNYLMPPGGPQFSAGAASMNLRLRRESKKTPLEYEGRADLRGGAMKIPGVSGGIRAWEGVVDFDRNRVKVDSLSGEFLGSRWVAKGELRDLLSPELDLTLQSSGLGLADLSSQIRALAPLSLSGTASLTITFIGKAASPTIEVELDAPSIRVAGIDLERVLAGVQLDKEHVKIGSLRASLWGGLLEGGGEAVFPSNKKRGAPGRLDAKLAVRGIELARWRYKGRNYFPLTGTANVDIQARGDLAAPGLHADLASDRVFLGGKDLGKLEIACDLLARDLRAHVKAWKGSLEGDMGLRLENGGTFHDSKFSVRRFSPDEAAAALAIAPDCSWLTPALRAKLSSWKSFGRANVDLDVELAGRASHPDLTLDILRGEGRLLTPARGPWATQDPAGLPFKVQGLVSLVPGSLTLGSDKKALQASVNHKGREVRALLMGSLPYYEEDGVAGQGMNLTMTADFRALEALKIFKGASGEGKLTMRFDGGLDAPSAYGTLSVKNFGLKMEKNFRDLRNGTAEIKFDGQDVKLKNLSFESGGRFDLEGELDFSEGWMPYGSLKAHTDSKGLEMVDLAGVVDGYVVLDDPKLPLTLDFKGEDGLTLEGKLRLYNTVLRVPKLSSLPVEDRKAAYPIAFDMKAAVGKNVWIKKEEEALDVFDLPKLFGRLVNSVVENYRSPAFEFLLSPTERDFEVQGTLRDPQLTGTLGIQRGALHFLENDFQIDTSAKVTSRSGNNEGVDQTEQGRSESGVKTARVVFYNGKRGDVNAVATAKVRYYVENAFTGRQDPKSVMVSLILTPLSEEALVSAGLQDAFLNYTMNFSSDPPLSNDHDQEKSAILSLLVLGVPLSQNAPEASGPLLSQDKDQGRDLQVASNQLGKWVSKVIRKSISRVTGSIGSRWVDYFRVAPKIRFQGANPRSGVATTGGSQAASNQIQENTTSLSWLVEAGKNVVSDLWLSLQVVSFSEEELSAIRAQSSSLLANASQAKEVRSAGVRGVAEYRMTPTRIFEFSYSYSLDENLDPIAFNQGDLEVARRFYGGLRNTLPLD
ncbi:MAG: hypothetical protein V4498_03345, partial [candidate division FCPU426 bacterium]